MNVNMRQKPEENFNGKVDIKPDFFLILNSDYKPVFTCENLLKLTDRPYLSAAGDFNTDPSIKHIAQAAAEKSKMITEESLVYYSPVYNMTFNMHAKVNAFLIDKNKYFFISLNDKQKSSLPSFFPDNVSDSLINGMINGLSGLILLVKKHLNKFVIVKANDKFYSEFRIPEGIISEKSIEQVLPKDIANRLLKSFELLSKKKKDYFKIETGSDNKKQYGVKVSVIGLPEGEDTFYVISFRDVTEILKYESKLKQSYSRQLYMHRLKSSFLQNMAHEIRTPYNSLSAYSDIIDEYYREGNLEKIRELLHSSKEVLGKVQNLFNNIIKISELESDKLKFNWVTLNCNTILESVCSQMKKEADDKGLGLSFHSSDEELVVKTDWAKMESVINILIENAIRTTHSGFIELTATNQAGYLSIEISDTGTGIDDDELRNLLHPDFDDDSPSISSEGVGIGLPIAMQLTKLLGGEMKVKSTKNLGTTVSLYFPLSEI